MPAGERAAALHGLGGAGHPDSERPVVAYRPAVAADFRRLMSESSRLTARAIAVTVDGELMGLIGLARLPTHLVLFADYLPESRPHMRRMATLRAIRKVLGWVEEKGLPVIATASPDEPEAPALLNRMGFERVSASEFGDVYLWQV